MAILTRKDSIMRHEWIEIIKTQAESLTPILNNLTLPPLLDAYLISDTFGRHSINRDGLVVCGEITPNTQGVYPLADNDHSTLDHFHYNEDDTEKNHPIGVSQNFWGFVMDSENGGFKWVSIMVYSDISYDTHLDITYTNRIPRSLNSTTSSMFNLFLDSVGINPERLWYSFMESVKDIFAKEKVLLNRILEMESEIEELGKIIKRIPR